MTVGSADRQKPTQKLYELLAQKNNQSQQSQHPSV